MSDPRTDMNDLLHSFQKTAGQIAGALITGPRLPEFKDIPGNISISVERGIVFPLILGAQIHKSADILSTGILTAVEPLIRAAPLAGDVPVVDRAGHTRSVYRPLLVYCWIHAFRMAYEALPRAQFGRWEDALRAWCDALEGRLGSRGWPVGSLAAADGAAFAEMTWTALTLHHAGKLLIRDAWTDLVADAFGHLARRQTERGAFLAATASDNPETHGYHELVILHAAASYAVVTEDRALAAAVERATAFHQAETQPDHATNQPWGLFAFSWNADTRPMADAMLHAVTAHAAVSGDDDEGLPPITLMLLADALYCLRLFIDPA